MNRRALIGFVLLNVVVTFAVTVGIISLWNQFGPQPTSKAPSIIQLIITATPDPNETRVRVVVVTATSGSGGANLSPAEAQGTQTAIALGGPVPTIDPALLPPGQDTPGASDGSPGPTQISATKTPVPGAIATNEQGCTTYILKAGDTAGAIADKFGVSLADLLKANNLTEKDLTRLQIGQVLVIPLNGCSVATETPTIEPTKFTVVTTQPTTTIEPTSQKPQLEIVQVISPGDITAEGVEIRNASTSLINMQGWKMTDSKGTTFSFPPEYRMFSGARCTIYTRAGTNTPIVLYWGQSSAVWGDPGEVVTILDEKGNVVATFPLTSSGNTVPTPTSTPT